MDKAKKIRLKRYITWGGIAALVALLAVMPLLAQNEAAADGPVASVLTAQVAQNDIPQGLRGGGTLEPIGAQDVSIPTGVKITEFLVRNGDVVTSGDPVARVDKVSVMAAITDVAETMDYLREELEDNRSEKVDSQVVATAGGRVKEIFASAGESVQDVMFHRGALALLSIDGLMAVKLEVASPVTTGESVQVKLPGGEMTTGRVESNLSGQVVVTVEDEGYAIGEKVSVFCQDGTALGAGELYVHNAWKAIAYSGTVSAVNVRKEQVLSSGAAMFTLTDTDYQGQMNRRASQHREYEELLQKLLAMYESGCITAPCDGIISGVDEDSVHLLSGETVEAEVVPLDALDLGNVRLMLLSSAAPVAACTETEGCPAAIGSHTPNCVEGCTGVAGCTNAQGKHKNGCPEECTKNSQCKAGKHEPGCYQLCTEAEDPANCPNSENGNHKLNCIKSCTRGTVERGTGLCAAKNGKHHYEDCIESCDSAKTANDTCDAKGAHKSSCIRTCAKAEITGVCRTGIECPHYLDCIESCTEKTDCPATVHKVNCELYAVTYTAKVAKVLSVGTTELIVLWDASGRDYPVVKLGTGWAITGGGFSEELLVKQGTLGAGNAGQFKAEDIVLYVTGYKGNTTIPVGAVFYKSSSAGGLGGFDISQFAGLSGMMGGFAGFGNYSGAATQETENLHDLKEDTLMTVTPELGMSVEISLDERDIAKVREGMAATIKVEALHGQSFTGAVTKVGSLGTHSGSTGKFAVEVETGSIPGSLPGMSSMVTIHLDIRESVLTLPVAAVEEVGAKTVVYTALDKQTGKPASPREITTGASDGQNVEVIGLEEGTKVYYLYYDVLEIDHSAKERQFNLN